MNILDENIIASQRQLLQSWRISFRQIGRDIGRQGIKDDEIIPLLHQLRRPTFFTADLDFYKPRLCHARYCLVYLEVEEDQTALIIRRVLRHPNFDTERKRVANIVRASVSGLTVWHLHAKGPIEVSWAE